MQLAIHIYSGSWIDTGHETEARHFGNALWVIGWSNRRFREDERPNHTKKRPGTTPCRAGLYARGMTDRASGRLINTVRLRDVIPDDLPTLFQFQLDPDSVQMAGVKPRSAEAFDEHWTKILSDHSIVVKAILADEQLVGNISCFIIDGQDYVGYWIAKEHWGRGIATRALALLLEQVMTRPLHARVARHNVASIHVLERIGFVIRGYQHSPGDDRYLECEEATLELS